MIIRLIVIWAFTDLMLTLYFIDHPGFCEANPIARFIISKGIDYLIFYKVMATTFVCLAYCHFAGVEKKFKHIFVGSFIVVIGVWFYFWLKFFFIIWSL